MGPLHFIVQTEKKKKKIQVPIIYINKGTTSSYTMRPETFHTIR